jgi:hypothetical protein
MHTSEPIVSVVPPLKAPLERIGALNESSALVEMVFNPPPLFPLYDELPFLRRTPKTN